jgi:hypothetical protein
MTVVLEKQKAMKTDGGESYPAEAYAYTPDKEKVSTWKLRLWETPSKKETAGQVGMAVAALGPGGFRGNRVQIPADDLPAVKRRVLEAWLMTHPDETRADAPNVLKSDSEWSNMRATPGPGKGHHNAAEWADDAMTLLLMAYRSMLDNPACSGLLDPLMEIIHAKQQIMLENQGMYESPGEMPSEVPRLVPSNRYGTMTAGDAIAFFEGNVQAAYGDEDEKIGKVISEQDGEFCVLSEDGEKNFGCYATEEAAQARLAEVEGYASKHLSSQTTEELLGLLDRVTSLEMDGSQVVADLIRSEVGKRNAASACICKADEERRYTLGPVYIPGTIDAHGDYTDKETLQKALWGWVRKGDRSIRLQHTRKQAGEMVEMLTWPFEVTAKMRVPGEGDTDVTFPVDTPFMGVVWEPWAWDLVKAGELRGYSIGGRARRVEAEFASTDQS